MDKLDTLSTKFNSLLTQYQDIYKEFKSLPSTGNVGFKIVNNAAFIGTSNIDTIQNTGSADDCLIKCQDNGKCVGATFNTETSDCILSAGQGSVVDNQEKSVAIVQQALYYSHQLQLINEQLLSVNQEIALIVDSQEHTSADVEKKRTELQTNYQQLLHEREEIQNILQQYQTIDSAYENQSIVITSNYYYYVFYTIIAFFLIFMLIKLSFSAIVSTPTTSTSSVYSAYT